MTPIGELDRMADRVAELNRLYHLQLTAILARTLDQTDPTTPRARHEMDIAVEQAQRFFLERFWEVSKAHMELLRDGSLKGQGLSEPQRAELDGLLKDELDDVSGRVIQLSFTDAHNIRRSLRKFALTVSLMVAGGRSHSSAVLLARQGVVRGQTFHLHDSMNRSWKSDVFVRALYRGWLVRVRVETYLYALAAKGIDLVKVVHPDPKHENHGKQFSISGETEGVPSYLEVRDEMFHPNSVVSVQPW